MSHYNHMHDSQGTKDICNDCGKKFSWSEEGPFYPGGKGTEFIYCPYCNSKNGSIRTSGSVYVSKSENE